MTNKKTFTINFTHRFELKNLLALKLLFVAILVFFTSSALGASKDVEALANKLKNLNSMEADFVQISIDGKGLRVQELEGKAKLKRPNLMYWKTQEPFEQLMISNGKKIWFYEKDLEQVSIKKLDNRSSSTPLLVLFEDVKKLGESFLVEYRKKGGIETFILEPKTKDTLFETLTLTYINSRLSKIILSDSLNQKTLINLRNAKFNLAFKNSEFEFKIPAGVDVIDAEQ